MIEDRHIHAGGLAQRVLAAGPADGRPVLLLHGLGWESDLWRPQLARLGASGWRACAVDLRGHGGSEAPGGDWQIRDFAADAAALLDTLATGPAAVVGFSLGGTIALALADRRPDLVGALGLACCGVASRPEGVAATEAMLERAARLGAVAFAEEQAEAIWSGSWRRANRAAVAAFVARRSAMDQAVLTKVFRAGYGIDLTAALGRVAVPALVIAAADDRFVSVERMAAIAAALPDGRMETIAASGHMVMHEAPAPFDAALAGFLTEAWPPPSRAAAPARGTA